MTAERAIGSVELTDHGLTRAAGSACYWQSGTAVAATEEFTLTEQTATAVTPCSLEMNEGLQPRATERPLVGRYTRS